MPRVGSRNGGFTLIEVLIAMAITAFVSILSYQTLSTALVGIERSREQADRSMRSTGQ